MIYYIVPPYITLINIPQSEQKWKQLAELATSKCDFKLAQECLHQAQDFGGLLLLASASGNAEMVGKLGDSASENGQKNVAFLSYFVLGKLDECLETLISTNRCDFWTIRIVFVGSA